MADDAYDTDSQQYFEDLIADDDYETEVDTAALEDIDRATNNLQVDNAVSINTQAALSTAPSTSKGNVPFTVNTRVLKNAVPPSKQSKNGKKQLTAPSKIISVTAIYSSVKRKKSSNSSVDSISNESLTPVRKPRKITCTSLLQNANNNGVETSTSTTPQVVKMQVDQQHGTDQDTVQHVTASTSAPTVGTQPPAPVAPSTTANGVNSVHPPVTSVSTTTGPPVITFSGEDAAAAAPQDDLNLAVPLPVPAQQQQQQQQQQQPPKKKKVTFQPPPGLENYKINKQAELTFKTAKNQRSALQRFHLRASQLRQMIKQKNLPSCFYGPESLPGYYIPLSLRMAQTICERAFALAEAAYVQLLAEEKLLKQRADTSLELVKLIYEREGDPNFGKARLLLEAIIKYYRTIEIQKLRTQYDREVINHPNTDEDLGQLVVKNANQPKSAPKQKQGAQNNRQRKQSPAPGPSRSRGRGRGAPRGGGRGGQRQNPYWRRESPYPPPPPFYREQPRGGRRGRGQARPGLTVEDLSRALAPLFN